MTSYGYDSRDRVLSVVHRNASNVVLASVVYERSASGEPTKITREDGTYTRVEYDSALRVRKESSFDANDVLIAETQYGYDLDGNRTTKTTLTGSETYSYAAGFKLTGISGTEGNEGYSHDAGGRLTGVDRGGVHRVMEYDSVDHITKVTDGGLQVEQYTFDGMGRRVGVGAGASAKRFLIAPNLGDGYESPQAVTDGSGNLVATYVYAGEHPIMKIGAGGQVEYLLADSMGSVIGKAGGAGVWTASIKYTAFGEVESAVGAAAGIDSSVGAEPRFHGMTLDEGTGLYFVRARTYDARTGRFVSRDPMAGFVHVPETFNPYAFAKSNPLVWQDPTGEFSVVEVMVTTAIAGVLAVSEAAAAAAAHYLLVTLSAAATAYGIHKVVEASPSLDDIEYAVGRGITAISTILINQTSRGNVKDTGIVEEMQRLAERIREAGSPAPDPCRLLEILEQAAKVSGDRKYLKRIQTTQKAFGCRKHREPGE